MILFAIQGSLNFGRDDFCGINWDIPADKDLEKKKAELASDNEFHVHVHSKRNKAGLCCSIFYKIAKRLIFMYLPMETVKVVKSHSIRPKRVQYGSN